MAHPYDESPVETPSAVARAAGLLQEQVSRITANWVLRVGNIPAFRAIPDLSLSQVQDSIPQLLDAALSAMATSDPTIDPESLQHAIDLAAEHGRKRANAGFMIGVVLAEFQLLRQEVWSALWRIVDADPLLAEAPRELQSRLSHTFDSLMIAAAESWAEARLS